MFFKARSRRKSDKIHVIIKSLTDSKVSILDCMIPFSFSETEEKCRHAKHGENFLILRKSGREAYYWTFAGQFWTCSS